MRAHLTAGTASHDGTHHRRQGHRGGAAREGRRRSAAARARAWTRAGPRGRAGRRESRERRLCALEGEADRRSRHEVVRPSPARARSPRASCWRWSKNSTPIRRCTASWCSFRCRGRSTARKCSNAIDPRKDVDGFHPVNAGRLATGLPALTPCTPLGCVMLAKTVHRVARRPGGRDRRPLEHRRQAADPAAAQRERHRDGRAFEDARSARGVPPRRRAVRGGRPARDGARRLDQARRDRDRCRHQSRRRRRTARAASSATWPSRKPREVAGAITPVPGGVGPMTIACLLVNTVRAACAIHGLPKPARRFECTACRDGFRMLSNLRRVAGAGSA